MKTTFLCSFRPLTAHSICSTDRSSKTSNINPVPSCRRTMDPGSAVRTSTISSAIWSVLPETQTNRRRSRNENRVYVGSAIVHQQSDLQIPVQSRRHRPRCLDCRFVVCSSRGGQSCPHIQTHRRISQVLETV